MPFYEPSFVTFFAAFYALYLLATASVTKKSALLITSVLFYLWGEPVFVLVLLLSTAADYALSFYLTDKAPHRSRRLALTVGIAGNLGLLIVYKYADFLLGNFNALLSPFGPHLLPLLHIALPIGVSFVVFEKIMYLVDTYRGVSQPAASLWDYALFVFFFPKLLAGPILKYHEMAAHLPEHFLDRLSCPSTPAARAQLVPQYVNALRDSGINVLDGAGLIHALKGRYEVDLFPQGGEHWNDLGGALVVSALVTEINAQAGREIVPPFTFTYTLSQPTGGADRELADLLNVFFPPLGYLTPKVKYVQSTPCGQGGARTLDAAIVGSSFGHLPASILIEHNCLSALNLYYYARLGRFGGVPYHELQRNLGDDDLAALRHVKLMIIEDNESLIGRSEYFDDMLRVVGR
jgi:hypothetical protein